MDKRPVGILVLYSWDRLWSMGPGCGSPDFHLSLKALSLAFERVTVVHPAGAGRLPDELPGGVEAVAFPWPERTFSLGARFGRRGKAWLPLRALLFGFDWIIRLAAYCLFTHRALRTARKTARRQGVGLVAAYGYMSVRAGRTLSRELKVPFVVRLFGVSLGMKGFSTPVRLAQFEEVLSFRPGADRWVITDDGSGGAEAAVRMGVPRSKVVEYLCAVERRWPEAAVDRVRWRESLSLPGDCRVALRVCRLWAQQRLERLIEALPEKLPDGTPVAAVIAGEGPERARLERLADRLGKRVVFTGAIPREQLPALYLAADLYLATAARTNLTNSVLEALCYGLPVLALDEGGVGRVVLDGVNGRLVQSRDPERLKEEIIQMLSDQERLGRLSAGARRTAEELVPDFDERMRREAEAFRFSG